MASPVVVSRSSLFVSDHGVDLEEILGRGRHLELLDSLLVGGAQGKEDLRVSVGRRVLLVKVDGLGTAHETDAGSVAALGVLGGVGHRDAWNQHDVGTVLLDVLDDHVSVNGINNTLGLQGLATLAKRFPPIQLPLDEGITLLLDDFLQKHPEPLLSLMP